MERIEWDPGMETGDDSVDGQHQRLVALFNELLEADPDERGRLQDVFERLTEYVLVHFSAEESMMERYSYPESERDRHIAEHRALTERTRAMVLAYRTGEISSVRPVVDVLYDWLVHHVEERDRLLVEHVTRLSNAS